MRIIITILLSICFMPCFPRQVTLALDAGNVINHVGDAQSFYGIANDGSDTVNIPLVPGGYCGLGGIAALPGDTIVVHVSQKITLYEFDFGDLKRVKFDLFDPSYPSLPGCLIENGTRGMNCNGFKLQYVVIANIEIYNMSDYAGYFYHNRTYTGDEDSTNHHVVWRNIYAHNTHGDLIHIQSGEWDSCTIAYNEVDTMQSGDVFYLHNFHHMLVYGNHTFKTGTTDTRHVAVFDIAGGDGDIFLNKTDSSYGQQGRLNGVSLAVDKTSPMGHLNFFLNTFTNNIKYGQAEVNNDNNNADTSSTLKRPTHYHVDYNTACNISDSDFHDLPYDANGNGGRQLIFYTHLGGLTAIGNYSSNSDADYSKTYPSITGNSWIMNGNGSAYPTDTSYTIYSRTGIGFADTVTGQTTDPGPLLKRGGPHLSYIDAALARIGLKIEDGPMNIGAIQRFVDIRNQNRHTNILVVTK